jgi:PQQ-dependent dehydrogenase (methanol/ethanol family)
MGCEPFLASVLQNGRPTAVAPYSRPSGLDHMPQSNPRYRLAAALSAALLLFAACHRGGRNQQANASGEARAVSATAPQQPAFVGVTDQALADPAGDNWLSYGGGFTNQRYSTLDQLTTSNVSDLALAWIYQTGVPGSFETTPVVAGNVMFLTTPESHVVALNAASGDRLWEFVPPLGRASLCCGPNNRGVAVYGDKVYVGSIDGHLFGLDQRTGGVVWQAAAADSADPASITMAPLAYDGRVFVGIAGGEFGIRGRVLAFNAETGAPLWRFNTIPDPGSEGQSNGWFGRWRETDPFGTPLNRDVNAEKASISAVTYASFLHGGGGVYTTPAYDPTTATLFFCVGNPSPDFDGSFRGGDNLFTGSVVALNARTGQLKWYFQEVPHDLWNLSPASPPFLFDVKGHRYVGQAGNTGWLYVVDAATGAPVLRSDNFVPQENLFAPTTVVGVRMSPGPNGGAGWAPAAFSPHTALAYVQAVHQPSVYTRSPTPRETGALWLGGSVRYVPGEAQWGTISAIDLATGQIRWQRQTPTPNASGLLATAGDLLFAGEGDGHFDAFDARSGDLLWQYPAGAGVSGGAVTYSIGGVQYVAVAAGGDAQLGTRPGDNVYVFALRSRIPPHSVGTYPQPRYARGGPLRAGGRAGAGAPVQPPTTSPAPPPAPGTTTAGAPAPGQPGIVTTTAGTTGGAAPPARHPPAGPRILGKPIPNPTPPPR